MTKIAKLVREQTQLVVQNVNYTHVGQEPTQRSVQILDNFKKWGAQGLPPIYCIGT